MVIFDADAMVTYKNSKKLPEGKEVKGDSWSASQPGGRPFSGSQFKWYTKDHKPVIWYRYNKK